MAQVIYFLPMDSRYTAPSFGRERLLYCFREGDRGPNLVAPLASVGSTSQVSVSKFSVLSTVPDPLSSPSLLLLTSWFRDCSSDAFGTVSHGKML